MGNLQVKKVTVPACGAGCDFCVDEFEDPRCFACGGPFSEATGHTFHEGAAYCGPCCRKFLPWYRDRMHPRTNKGPDFYAAASTSIRPPIDRAALAIARQDAVFADVLE